MSNEEGKIDGLKIGNKKRKGQFVISMVLTLRLVLVYIFPYKGMNTKSKE
ncbi:hypothetical protein [Methanosarcina horonobensis]|nr:hypothetical protein [Methanosarcina horonobensis]